MRFSQSICRRLASGQAIRALEGHVAWVRSLFCHEHEPLLFSGSDDGEIKIWRTDTNQLHGGFQANAGGVLAINVDYDRAWLLAGCYGGSMHATYECDKGNTTKQ